MDQVNITELLHRWSGGDRECAERLFPMVYDELRRIGESVASGERPGHTLQPTALVHEFFLRLANQNRVTWNDRAHFFAIAARVMRHVLVDHGRRRLASKRGGNQERVPLAWALDVPAEDDRTLVALNESLDRLAEFDPERARLVELRYFTGLTLEQIAGMDGVSLSTVKRDWTAAKLWLYKDIQGALA